MRIKEACAHRSQQWQQGLCNTQACTTSKRVCCEAFSARSLPQASSSGRQGSSRGGCPPRKALAKGKGAAETNIMRRPGVCCTAPARRGRKASATDSRLTQAEGPWVQALAKDGPPAGGTCLVRLLRNVRAKFLPQARGAGLSETRCWQCPLRNKELRRQIRFCCRPALRRGRQHAGEGVRLALWPRKAEVLQQGTSARPQ